MALPRYIPHYTVEEYRLWKGDWELWSGVAVSMSPSAKRLHQRICGRLFRLLSDTLDDAGCADCEVTFEVDWVVSDDTVFRPDLLITCGHRPSDFIEETPVFVAEILSDSTRQRDLLYKREAYQELGVRYYLILDPQAGTIKLLENSERGYVDCEESRMTFHPECEIEIDFSSVLDDATS